jgi:hypothetical protein
MVLAWFGRSHGPLKIEWLTDQLSATNWFRHLTI